MNWNMIVDLVHKYLPSTYLHKGLELLGALTALKATAQKLLARGVSAATNAADATAKFLLNSPARSLILWQAPLLVSLLDSLTAALVQIATTFKTELEKDLQNAQADTTAKN